MEIRRFNLLMKILFVNIPLNIILVFGAILLLILNALTGHNNIFGPVIILIWLWCGIDGPGVLA